MSSLTKQRSLGERVSKKVLSPELLGRARSSSLTGRRSSRFRRKYRMFIGAAIFLLGYLAASFFLLTETEEAGNNENVLILLLGAVISVVVGCIVGLAFRLNFTKRNK